MVYKSLDNKKLSPFYHLSVVLHESDTSAVSFMTLILDNSVATVMRCYRAFHKHANSEVQKPTDDCVFRCRQSS